MEASINRNALLSAGEDREPYWSCYYIESAMSCNPDNLSFCCQRSHVTLSVEPAPTAEDTVDHFFAARKALIRANQGEEAPCKGCALLQKRRWCGDGKIEWLGFSTHSWCQFSCIYCMLQRDMSGAKNKEERYDCLAIARELKARGLLSSRLIVGCAPGEICVHPQRQRFYDFIEECAYQVSFVSNAGIFDRRIAEILQTMGPRGCMITSIDSGTAETFHKVRGVDLFDKVIENLKRYREYTPNIQLKYILLDENCAQQDLNGFLSVCRAIGPSQVIITGDLNKSADHTLTRVPLEEHIVEAAYRLALGAIESRLLFRFEDYLGKPNLAEISRRLAGDHRIADSGAILDRLLTAQRLIWYGAGRNSQALLPEWQALGLREPDIIWDRKADKAQTQVMGFPMCYPEFDILDPERDAIVITIANEAVNQELADVMQNRGFGQFMTQYDVQLALAAKQAERYLRNGT